MSFHIENPDLWVDNKTCIDYLEPLEDPHDDLRDAAIKYVSLINAFSTAIECALSDPAISLQRVAVKNEPNERKDKIMKDSEAAAIANPGPAAQRAVAAMQGPGVTASITTSPRNYTFDPEDTPPKRKVPYIPSKYRGRIFDIGNNRTLQQKAEEDGLETVEIIQPESLDQSRTDWGVLGLRGKNLKPGDREQMPVCHAIDLVQNGVAVFVVSSETAKDEKLISELEAKGYRFATTTPKPAREREEFRDVLARKTGKWMASVLNPALAPPQDR